MTASRPPLADRYELQERVAVGGQGEVWRAWDPRIRRPVAVKFLHAHLVPGEGRERFMREAEALGRLRHPAVVQLYDVVETDDAMALVMEYVPGAPLSDLLTPEGLDWPTCVQIGSALAGALGAAHREGVVHRDVKPGERVDRARRSGPSHGLRAGAPGRRGASQPHRRRDGNARVLGSRAGARPADHRADRCLRPRGAPVPGRDRHRAGAGRRGRGRKPTRAGHDEGLRSDRGAGRPAGRGCCGAAARPGEGRPRSSSRRRLPGARPPGDVEPSRAGRGGEPGGAHPDRRGPRRAARADGEG